MDSIKWKCKNWIVNVKKFNCRKVEHVQLSSNFFLFNCTKVGRVQLSSNFFPLLSLISPSRMRFEYVLAMWRKKHTLRDVISLLYRDKNKKDKSLKRMSDKFQIFSDWYFRIKFCFKCEIFFQLTLEILKLQLCF